MKITAGEIKQLISYLNFIPEDGQDNIYFKKYENHNDYIIRIDFNNRSILYRDNSLPEEQGITWGDATTSNFENSENFVVLECVDRLLQKGYQPKSITLEKKYPLGRKLKGKLDITVNDKDEKPYIMIECKTWGAEFDKEHKKMIRDGGQLFSYYALDRAAQFLCLYSSDFNNSTLEYKSEIVPVDDAWHELSNAKEIHDHWNKNFKDNGIFEHWINAYDVDIKALVRGKLKELNKDTSGTIFNQFAEILRHNVVSDKPNAFNKILNLFICKIIDEDKNNDEQLEFQWLEDDTYQSLQLRLNDLYKRGMHKFLDIDVTDYTEKDIDDKLINIYDNEEKRALKEIFVKLRLQKNPEFAFIEVYDDTTFNLNGRIVKEVVELLQPYRFRYGHKQQFLGDFFEKLLNTSMKQEAGQFFTPTPIAHYIISCLPLKEMIVDKLENNNSDDILPVMIDFACGTGHFLTEYMDMVQNIIEKLDVKVRPTYRKKLNYWCSDDGKYEWSSNYVYGIDADYRLIKSAKVSCFLNGDGEANVIRASGLDNFEKSKEYKGKLKITSNENSKDNAQFDVLIANPPYSVNDFKSTVRDGEKSFELFNKLTDSSSEIECLFVERMKQLLKVGGYAGIILPSSILSNAGIYTATREILLKYFYIAGITEFGSNTFMATGTNTVTLFLKRRDNYDWRKIESAIESFFDKPKDVTVLGIEKAFSKYVNSVFDTISIDDYISFVNHCPTEAFKNLQIFKDYISWFNSLTEVINLKNKAAFKTLTYAEQESQLNKLFYEKVFAVEKNKLLYFLLVYPQKTVIVKTGEKQDEKAFLGYEFSNRRGNEGIKILPNGTSLYDEHNLINAEKANYYIYKAFLNEYPNIDDNISANVSLTDTYSLIDFSSIIFEKNISTSRKSKLNYSLLWGTDKLATLSSIAFIEKGNSITREDTIEGNIPVVAGGKDIAYYHGISNRNGDIITVSASGANSGYVNYWSMPIFASDCNTIKSKNREAVLTKYIYECLKMIQNKIYLLQRGQAQPHVYASDLEQIKIPVLPIQTQKTIVSDIEKIENNQQYNAHNISLLKQEIDNVVNDCFSTKYKYEKLGNTAQIFNGGTPSTSNAKNWNGNIYWATLADTKNKYVYNTQRKITDKGLSSSNAVLLPVNSVLFSSRATIGDVSIAKVEISTNQGYKNFVCNPEVISYEYLYYVLKHEAKNIEALASGMTYPEISKAMISEYKIPLPKIEEQTIIVDKIIAIEQEIDKLEAEIASSEEQKKTILKNHLSDYQISDAQTGTI